MKGGEVIFLIIAFLMVLSGSSVGETDEVRLRKDGVIVRGGPGSYYLMKATADKGSVYPVLERAGRWIRIRLSGEESGWIPENAVEPEKGGFDLRSSLSEAVGGKEASSTTPTAAAKGFNKDVEKKVAEQRDLDYSAVNAMESYTISSEEMEAFLEEGGLRP